MENKDQIYIDAVLAGNSAEFAVLVDRYKLMVYQISYRILNNTEEAEECAQDIFMKLYEKLDQYRGESAFSTWLYTLAYRTAISRKRSFQEQLLDWNEESVASAYQLSLNDADAIKGLHKSERKAFVAQALKEIPAIDALLLSLFYLEEQHVDEICTITTLSKSNVKVRLMRARQRFFKVLEAKLPGEMKSLL